MEPVIALGLVAFRQAKKEKHHIRLFRGLAGVTDQAFIRLVGRLIIARGI